MAKYWQAILKTVIDAPSISTRFRSLLNDDKNLYDKHHDMSSGEVPEVYERLKAAEAEATRDGPSG
jgi:hypothetical protein